VLDRLSNLLNRVNDWDLTWVGFRSHRPSREQNMTLRLVATLCLVYCPLSGLMAYWACLLAIRFIMPRLGVNPQTPAFFPWIFAAAGATTFVLLQSLLAWAWNRRAARLRKASRWP
jgi:hypothetical protein